MIPDMKLTPAQEDAGQAVAAAARMAADAWPLPDVPYLTGIGGEERHAIDREFFEESRRRHGGAYTRAECGRPVPYASQYPVYAGDWPPHVSWCADCAWQVAAAEGDLGRQVRALIPPARDDEILARLMGDPLIAVNAAAMLVDATGRDEDTGAFSPEAIRVLAAITRHAPVILVPEECADGSCEHDPAAGEDGEAMLRRCCAPDAAVACKACSVQAGPEAGEWAGQFLSACTIPAPCAPLTALAAHAERACAEARVRHQDLASTGEGRA